MKAGFKPVRFICVLRVRKDVRRFWERPGLFGALVDYDKTLMVRLR